MRNPATAISGALVPPLMPSSPWSYTLGDVGGRAMVFCPTCGHHWYACFSSQRNLSKAGNSSASMSNLGSRGLSFYVSQSPITRGTQLLEDRCAMGLVSGTFLGFQFSFLLFCPVSPILGTSSTVIHPPASLPGPSRATSLFSQIMHLKRRIAFLPRNSRFPACTTHVSKIKEHRDLAARPK